jgi:hypothetical protein
LDSIGLDAALVKQALQRLDGFADGVFADREPLRREAALQQTGGALLMALTRIIARSYYRDDRVMRSLGMEVRAPFPKGFEVEQGDWLLLDPVRARAAFHRRTP